MVFLSRVMGAATMGTALMTAAVKDAADQGRQGERGWRLGVHRSTVVHSCCVSCWGVG